MSHPKQAGRKQKRWIPTSSNVVLFGSQQVGWCLHREANPLHSIHDSNANLTLTDNILEIFLVNWMEENTEIQCNDINCFVNVANVKKQTAAKLFGTVLIALIYFFQLLEQLFSMASPHVRGTTFVSLCPIPFFPLHRTRFISSSLCFFPLPFLLLLVFLDGLTGNWFYGKY